MRLEARCQSLMLEVEFGSYFLLPKAFFSQPNSFPETLHELVIKFAFFFPQKSFGEVGCEMQLLRNQ